MPRLVRLAALGWRVLGFAVLATTILALLAIGIGPRTGAYQVRTVLTGSMRPTIPEGSLVVVTPVRLSDLRVDDVITYRIPAEDRRIVTHRITEIKVGGPTPVVVTKGDANRAVDPWVAHLRGETAWKLALSIPKIGYGFEALRKPLLKRATVLVAPALLAGMWLLSIWRSPATDGEGPEPEARAAPQPPAGPPPPSPRSATAPHPLALSQEERLAEWRERRVHQPPVRPRTDG